MAVPQMVLRTSPSHQASAFVLPATMNFAQADTAQPRSRMRVSWASQHLSGYWKGRDSWIEVFNMANNILCIREVPSDPRASISVPLLVVMMYINVHATVVRSYYLYSDYWHVREHPPRRRKLRMDRVDLAINVTGSTLASVVARLPTRISDICLTTPTGCSSWLA